MNMMMLAEFVAKARIQKTGLAVYFWTTLLAAKLKLPALCGEDTFAQIALLIIVCAFLGNVAEHYVKARYGIKTEATDARPAA